MFNIATIISALFCLAAAALWVRSYWITDFVCYERFNAPYASIAPPVAGDTSPSFPGAGTRFGPLAIYCMSLQTEPGNIRLTSSEQITPHGGGGLNYSSWELISGHWGGNYGNTVHWDRLGFLFVTSYWYGKRISWDFGVPYWFMVMLGLIAPVRWISTRRHRQYVPGHCRSCGYDLRATPTRCPECGLEVQ
ncbi:MAG: hypothetical protein H7144_13745 [Burkholderiales bacterium]|nr:hypothetical protein [Phycisphaerae bacterium]